ncbi:helicase HerA-like domain-containing protein, partial [Klebsiella pneumoniae]|uniref:helicase HerA-like domain-containing protein n=1 Tax=Klebsiella pneumoniae TaxID=573 RepID=UPI00210D3957
AAGIASLWGPAHGGANEAARLLNLNEVQSGVLNIIFRIADDRGLLLLDFKDLRAITQFIGDNAKSFQNHEKALFPYEYPALFSIAIAFIGIW